MGVLRRTTAAEVDQDLDKGVAGYEKSLQNEVKINQLENDTTAMNTTIEQNKNDIEELQESSITISISDFEDMMSD